MKYAFLLAAIFAVASAAGNCKSTGCTKYGSNYCCSYWGYCGTTADYCGSGKYQCVCDCAAKGACVKTPTTPTTPVSGNSNEEKIWNYLYGKLGNKYGVAGLMGNLYAESGLIPNNLQNSYERSLGYSDSAYTSAVDSGKYKNFVRDSAGYGLAQWTYWSRKQNLLNYAKSKGASIGDLTMQLGFLWQELSTGYTSVVNTLKSAKSVLEASNSVLLKYERPADQSVAVQNKRASYGQNYYNKYAKSVIVPETPKTPTTCTNKCTTTYLNVRKGPSTSYTRIKTLDPNTKVCVVSTTNGWSKLNDGTYVSANYLTTCPKVVVDNGSFYAQQNFSKTASSAERNIRTSGCLFLCYCKSAGITTKQGIINAYNKCVNAGAMRSDCYVYHYEVKKQLGISKKVKLVIVKGSGNNDHWLLRNTDTQFWDPWDNVVHPKSYYTVRGYREF